MPAPLSAEPLRLAVLISGAGTTLKNLLDSVAAGQLPVKIQLVISSSSQAKGLHYAREAGIETQIVRSRDHATPAAYSNAIFEPCRQMGIGLVVMAGFLKFVPIPDDFENRVMNIHPSLIPAFCGPGYYGMRVHQAVLEYGAKISGCTVHFVDNEYDHGPIIVQRSVVVRSDDSPESLQGRIFAEECAAYPAAIRLFAEDRLRVAGRTVTTTPLRS